MGATEELRQVEGQWRVYARLLRRRILRQWLLGALARRPCWGYLGVVDKLAHPGFQQVLPGHLRQDEIDACCLFERGIKPYLDPLAAP
jgi:hypothetical protein